MPPPLVTTTLTAQDGKRSPRLFEFRSIADVDNEEEEEEEGTQKSARKGKGSTAVLRKQTL